MAITRPQPKKGAQKGSQKGSSSVLKTQVKKEFPQRSAPPAAQPFWQKKPAPKTAAVKPTPPSRPPSRPVTASRPASTSRSYQTASKGSAKGSSTASSARAFKPALKKEITRPFVSRQPLVRQTRQTVPFTTSSAKGKGKGPGKWVRVSDVQSFQKTGFAARMQSRNKSTVNKQRTVAKDFEVDSDARHTGTVGAYWKLKGYGFIDLDEKGVVPDDKIFVYWKDIKSDDRFPFLQKDMQVEFTLGKKRAGSRAQVFAKQVSLPGDVQVSLQDEVDQNKEFIGDQSSRYTGHLKFFSPKHGFGYITIDDGQGIDEGVPKELRVETSEVNAGGRHPRHMKDMTVEFGIWKTKKDKHKAYNMTLPGGEPFSTEQLENRSDGADGEEFQGTVKIWCHKFGWGFIMPTDDSVLPENVKAKIEEMNKATKKKGKKVENEGLLYFRRNDLRKGYRCEKDASVAFQVYTDDKGAGACDIHEA